MAEIFISYATRDRTVAARLGSKLHELGWSVFWDRRIEPGAEWNEEIQRELHGARCVIVLWSAAAKSSFWVAAEAAEAFERNTHLFVRIDDAQPPRLFSHVQSMSIAGWLEQSATDEFDQLTASIRTRIGPLPMHGNLEEVAAGSPMTDVHLHLIHSCWRVDRRTEYGVMPYQIHLIVYGHPSALARVENVEYRLPEYPKGHDRQAGGPKERLFELKELANGFCIAGALVRVKGQPAGHSSIVRLTRFVNMSESGPRLSAYIRDASRTAFEP
jgi:hypothetical protein